MSVPYTRIKLDGTQDEINQQWLAERKKGLGGSDVAAVLGLSPWKSAYDLWMEKTGRVEAPDISNKPNVEWGTILEGEIAKKFAREHPEYKVTKLNAILKSKEHPWMLASLDRRLRDENGNSGVLEIKTASGFAASSWDEGVPDYYQAQIAHYLAITGWDYAIVAVLIGGQDYQEFMFTREDLQDIMDQITTKGGDFWYNYILSDIEPDCSGLPSESTTLITANPLDENAQIVDADNNKKLDSLIKKFNQLSEKADDINQSKLAVANNIKKLIGSNKGLQSDNFVVTWTRSARRTFDKKSFEKDHPGLTDDYYTESVVNGSLKIKRK